MGTTAARDWKDLLRYRVGLVRIGTRLRVRLRNLAQRYGKRLEASDVDSAKGRVLWAAWELRGEHRLRVDPLLAVFPEVEARVAATEEAIAAGARAAVPARVIEILDSLPGVGLFGAYLIAAEVGDWSRLPSGPALACFAGLVPSEASSGDRIIRGRITKEGSSYLRWIMVQAALKHAGSPRLPALFTRVAERRGAMKARVAVARELLVGAWHLRLVEDPAAIVLDLFAGSSTTGQAVMELNTDDGATPRFILVHRPEPIAHPRFPTLASITREHIRRAEERLRPGSGSGADLGFRLIRQHGRPRQRDSTIEVE